MVSRDRILPRSLFQRLAIARRRKRGTHSQQGMWASQNGEVQFERCRIIGQAEGVDRALAGYQLSPPESRFDSDEGTWRSWWTAGLAGSVESMCAS
jgi:hypothetical protein